MRAKLARRVKVIGDEQTFRFICHGPMEEYRAQTLYIKEEGTIQWIRDSVRAGDVFLDVGANIGLYTLIAAQQVGESGLVYAVEPHIVNAQSLLRNIHANGMQRRVRALTCALHETSTILNFNYCSLDPGTSMSQLDGTRDGDEQEFSPVACELKQAVAVDDLVAEGSMRAPTHVKIDIDGNELLILRGMRRLLSGPLAPQTLQVEINRRYGDALFALMNEAGFKLSLRHYTLIGKQMIAAGQHPEAICHNAVFRPAPGHPALRAAA
jgi:FkbM family methyltransferase